VHAKKVMDHAALRSDLRSIGRDTILRENPVCCPVCDLKRGEWETPAITVTVAVPVAAAAPPRFAEDAGKKDEPNA